jgi:hypothetical protein
MSSEKQIEKIKRLESENKVLRQIISETVKALQNAEKFTSMTTLDTVAYVTNPYKDERKDPFNSPFGSGDH